jgi:hypothetical protein
VIWVYILATLGCLGALAQAWVLWKNLKTGTARYYLQTYERTKTPAGYWFTVILRVIFFLVLLTVGVIATYTVLGY